MTNDVDPEDDLHLRELFRDWRGCESQLVIAVSPLTRKLWLERRSVLERRICIAMEDLL